MIDSPIYGFVPDMDVAKWLGSGPNSMAILKSVICTCPNSSNNILSGLMSLLEQMMT